MPIYEYACDDCGLRYERIVINKSTAITCPRCASGEHTMQPSVFAAPANGNKSAAESSPTAASGGCGCTPSTCGCH
jgi:putative FmdB family regulatory protein